MPYCSLQMGIPEALSSGGCAGAESHPRRRHRHSDLWRLPRLQPPLPCPGNGRMLLREGHIPSRSSSGPEKARGDLPAQGLQNASGQTEDYQRPDRHALQLAPFRIPGLLWQPPRTERGDVHGKPGPVHHPGFLLPGTDAVSRRTLKGCLPGGHQGHPETPPPLSLGCLPSVVIIRNTEGRNRCARSLKNA